MHNGGNQFFDETLLKTFCDAFLAADVRFWVELFVELLFGKLGVTVVRVCWSWLDLMTAQRGFQLQNNGC